MVKINTTSFITRPLPDNCKLSIPCNITLPSSSPLRSCQKKLLVLDQATKKCMIDNNQHINININSSYSSSPIKKIIIKKNDKKVNFKELDSYSCDFSQINCYENQNSTTTNNNLLKVARNKLQDESYAIDENLSTFLNRFNNDGILDLGLDEISYGNNPSPNISYSKRNSKAKVIFEIICCNDHIETIIEIPNFEQINQAKDNLVSILKEQLIDSQKGSRKYKVVILTPRRGASWLERKLQNSKILTFDHDNQYVIVKTRKNFVQQIRNCLSQFM